MLQNNCDSKADFLSEGWHRPYAMALIETDPAKLGPLICNAEKAIFARYLQLRAVQGSEIQFRDLFRAIEEILILKERPSVDAIAMRQDGSRPSGVVAELSGTTKRTRA